MKSLLSASLACLFMLSAYSQTNHAPVAVSDTVEVVSQISTIIDVLANDYDPDGDSLIISYVNFPFYAQEVEIINNKIRFKSDNLIEKVLLTYRISDDNQPPLSSNSAYVHIYLLKNPNCPVANFEYYNLEEMKPIELDVMGNDEDPDGDPIKLYEIPETHNCNVSINADSTRVIVKPGYMANRLGSFEYVIREVNTPDNYLSLPMTSHFKIVQNPQIPVLFPDTANVTGGIPFTIPVLENDYDLQNDPFEVFHYYNPYTGTVTQVGDDLVYTAPVSFAGKDSFWYDARETDDTNIVTNKQKVIISVEKNPLCPVGVPDHVSGKCYEAFTIDAIANDYDPEGYPVVIFEVQGGGEVVIDNNKIIYTSNPRVINHDTIYYRIRRSTNHEYYSELTPIYIDLEQNPVLPVAVDDYARATIFAPVIISPMDNDIPNAADSLILVWPTSDIGYVQRISDSLLSFQPSTASSGQEIVSYYILDKNNYNMVARGRIFVDIEPHHFFDTLNINNIKAWVNADGLLFNKAREIPGMKSYPLLMSYFRYPTNQETSTIFNSLIWIGGVSDSGNLHFAGERYRFEGTDFQPGPVSDVYDSTYARKYWRLWKLNREDIEYHRYNWWKSGYQPVDAIVTWPGNGITEAGQADRLAPFKDIGQDGRYDPMEGDYPLIRGDQAIYFIKNDDKIHTESDGTRLRLEVQGMVYGFNAPGDSALMHTVFVHYDLINRSENIYYETYAGIWTEIDIGGMWDDYIGSDVGRNTYFGYNGNDFDEDDTEQPEEITKGYGKNPPAQSVTILAGPVIDADGTDNPPGGCDYGVNGINFGNDMVDDERYGLCSFMNNIQLPAHVGNPYYPAPILYNILKSQWYDGQDLLFGGDGTIYDSRAVGPGCRYVFPGSSDILNLGTGCLPPEEPYNTGGFYWTDSNMNSPGDRRGIGSMGPFTFKPGDVQEIELAYVVANGWNGPVSSVDKLMEYIDTLRARVQNGGLIVPNSELGYNEPSKIPGSLKIYPNPASDFVVVEIKGIESGCEYEIYDLFGRMVLSGILSFQAQNVINTNGLSSGLYVLMVKTDDMVYSGKIIRR